jgi:hypothetical protein
VASAVIVLLVRTKPSHTVMLLKVQRFIIEAPFRQFVTLKRNKLPGKVWIAGTGLRRSVFPPSFSL